MAPAPLKCPVTYVGRTDDVFKSSDYRNPPFELESAGEVDIAGDPEPNQAHPRHSAGQVTRMNTLIGTFVGIIVAAGLFLGLVYATRSRPAEPPVGLGADLRPPGAR